MINNFSYVRVRTEKLRRDKEYLSFLFRLPKGVDEWGSESGNVVFSDTVGSLIELESKRARWRTVCDTLGAELYMNVDTLCWRTTATESMQRVARCLATENGRWRETVDPTMQTTTNLWPKPSPLSPGCVVVHLNANVATKPVLMHAYRVGSMYQSLAVLAKKDGHIVIGTRDDADTDALLQSDEFKTAYVQNHAQFFHKAWIPIYVPVLMGATKAKG